MGSIVFEAARPVHFRAGALQRREIGGGRFDRSRRAAGIWPCRLQKIRKSRAEPIQRGRPRRPAPVLRANWLKSGVHVNAAGANAATRREIDAETVLRATVRAIDHLAQAKEEAAEYRDLVAAGRLKWQDIVELGDIVTGKAPGRRGPADITLFKSLGIALEDIAFADLICRRAAARGVGKPVP